MIETAGSLGLTAPQLVQLVRAAGLAPSLHNTQPWRFRATTDTIELYADQTRRLPVADPDGKELRLACGAALFNLRIALLELGVRPTVSVLPDPGNPDLIAEVRSSGHRRPSPVVRRLAPAIPVRRTNRRPFADSRVPTEARHALRRAAVEEGAWLDLVTDPEDRWALSRLARTAHEKQMADPAFVAELQAWTGHSEDRTDGVPAHAGGPLPPPNSTWVLRDFSGGGGAQGRAYEADPVIGVLSAHDDGPREEIRTGEALQRVLLTATVEGLAVSFLSQLVEVPEARTSLQRLVSGRRPPQVVLRIGHGWPVPRTPRRDPRDLLEDLTRRTG
ncbi:MAG: nitroreductase [Pseudonocardiaceae bacterium]|nr:MAG: nitroreductase [Pseudonocardiaceae bacterium]